MFTYRVTCETIGCYNQGKMITIESESTNIHILCGPCGNVITGIVRVL